MTTKKGRICDLWAHLKPGTRFRPNGDHKTVWEVHDVEDGKISMATVDFTGKDMVYHARFRKDDVIATSNHIEIIDEDKP